MTWPVCAAVLRKIISIYKKVLVFFSFSQKSPANIFGNLYLPRAVEKIENDKANHMFVTFPLILLARIYTPGKIPFATLLTLQIDNYSDFAKLVFADIEIPQYYTSD